MANLYMFLIGCSPANRYTEQHDVFFAIGNSVKEVLPDVVAFWPEAKGKLHLDAWRIVKSVNGYKVEIVQDEYIKSEARLFFINLGGYKQNEFEEYQLRRNKPKPKRSNGYRLFKSAQTRAGRNYSNSI